uniref:Uncharacterized protein LOC105049972 isoform X3 n=1 Tax=Elaeis guineensis var. tenera TaxID=51953 RepID=A0A6I9RKH8_ELAGV|nr:uncharacterized protein LOC105049972 isoform X3 [Elaeis guineensis]
MLRSFFMSILLGTWKALDKAIRDFMSHSLTEVKQIFMPICLSSHWHLLIMDLEDTYFRHYISVTWFTEMARDVYSIDMDSWPLFFVDCPQQEYDDGARMTITDVRVLELRARYAT